MRFWIACRSCAHEPICAGDRGSVRRCAGSGVYLPRARRNADRRGLAGGCAVRRAQAGRLRDGHDGCVRSAGGKNTRYHRYGAGLSRGAAGACAARRLDARALSVQSGGRASADDSIAGAHGAGTHQNRPHGAFVRGSRCGKCVHSREPACGAAGGCIAPADGFGCAHGGIERFGGEGAARSRACIELCRGSPPRADVASGYRGGNGFSIDGRAGARGRSDQSGDGR